MSAEQFCVGSSILEGWQDAVDQCVEKLGSQPCPANLGFIYTTDNHVDALAEIVQRLKDKTGILHWVGTTGIGILHPGREDYERPSITVMACLFPESSFRVFSPVQDSLEDFDLQHQDWFGNNFQNFAVVHAAPEAPDLQQLIPELSETLNGGYLVGGLTSSHSRNLQVADTVASGGLSGVMFSEKVPVCTGLTQGCSPIGPKRTVTEVNHNIVVRIDERPALEVFKEDIGETLAADLARTAGYIFAGLPVVGSDTGDYLVRNIVGIDTENGLIAIGDLPQKGSQIMFCRRDGSTARDDLVRMLKQIRGRMDKAKPKGAVYFSCLGRGRYTFGTDSEEVGLIKDEFGDLPLVGFFANGEISHHRLYGYTGVLTLFM